MTRQAPPPGPGIRMKTEVSPEGGRLLHRTPPSFLVTASAPIRAAAGVAITQVSADLADSRGRPFIAGERLADWLPPIGTKTGAWDGPCNPGTYP